MKKGFSDKMIEAEERVKKRKMINVIPKDIKQKDRKELIEDEFLILDGKRLVISGGGLIALFYLLDDGYDKHLEKIKKYKTIEAYEQLCYFMKKLKHFKLNYKKFDKSKVIGAIGR